MITHTDLQVEIGGNLTQGCMSLQLSQPIHGHHYFQASFSGEGLENDPLGLGHDSLSHIGQTLKTELSNNAKGQVSYITLPYYDGDANTDRKSYTYDTLGRVLTETSPGLSISYAYNGLSTTVINNMNGQSATKTADASGSLIQSTDNGGAITYNYYASGQVRQINAPGSIQKMGYDQFGRQIYLNDPNTGGMRYGYNVYGELLSQTDTLNNYTQLTYDDIGRVTKRDENSLSTSWVFNPNGRLDSQSATSGISYGYNYDSYGRDTSVTESETNVFKTTFKSSYQYNSNGQISKVTYPSGFAVNYYYQNGYLSEIKRADNGASIWKLNAVNTRGQIIQSTSGNGLVTTKQYDSRGYLQSIKTGAGTIQDLAYSIDSKGNFEWRKDNRHSGITESFGYDPMNRLTSATINGITKSFTYATNGNILSKSDAGIFAYSASHPNAVETLTDNKGMVSAQKQDITYTSFSMPASIIENGNTAGFTYGPGHERKVLVTNLNGGTAKYYSGEYERQDVNGTTRELHYIVAYGQIVAIFEKKSSGQTNTYYVHTDHLGSLNVLTNASGTIVQETSYDAWSLSDHWRSNRRDPATLQNYTTPPTNLITDRGFTGHSLSDHWRKHLDAFKLINMNGRIYDPALGRFLSPDNYVQAGDFTQSYNRYSYCVNNPLMFTDPSGWYRIADDDNGGSGAGPDLNSIINSVLSNPNIPYGGFWSSNTGLITYGSNDEAYAAIANRQKKQRMQLLIIRRSKCYA